MANSWPPSEWTKKYNKFAEWAALYSGDPYNLMKVYEDQNFLWAQEIRKDHATRLHLPVAGDIAGTSADLLLSEMPEIKIAEAHEENAPEGAAYAQKRVDEIINEIDFLGRALEAAESASPLSGVFLKVNWDVNFKDFPIISVSQVDSAIPYFRWGFLYKVIFHKEVEDDGKNIYRKLEIHTPGKIENQLWKGSTNDLGSNINLNYLEVTQDLKEEINTGLDGLACVYIPNKRPNRLWRGSALGESDLSGIEGILDSIDKVYTNWMRDIRLAKGRIIVPDYMMELDEETGKFNFDLDQEVYEAVNSGVMSAEDGGKLTVAQFDIRAQKHAQTAQELLTQAYSLAGYSPQSFGMSTGNGSSQVTAKEVKAREGKSFKTRNKKAKYLQAGLEQVLYMALQIDRIHLSGKVKPEYKPQVILQDSIQTDPLEKADSIEKLNRATALSVAQKVDMLHPEWGDKQKKAEVDMILKESGMAVEDPEVRV